LFNTIRKELARAKARAARKGSNGGRAGAGVKAYVLIETAAGKTKAVKKGFAKIRPSATTVVRLDAVTGPFDFIAMGEGAPLDAGGPLLTAGSGGTGWGAAR